MIIAVVERLFIVVGCNITVSFAYILYAIFMLLPIVETCLSHLFYAHWTFSPYFYVHYLSIYSRHRCDYQFDFTQLLLIRGNRNIVCFCIFFLHICMYVCMYFSTCTCFEEITYQFEFFLASYCARKILRNIFPDNIINELI